MNEFVFTAADERDTERLGAILAAALPAGAAVALCGILGAGKTRLVQAIATALSVPREDVVSPTFVLCQQYRGSRVINHLDAYRVADEDELRELGVEELFDSGAITIVEWAERVSGAMPEEYLRIEIEVTGATTRRFVVSAVGPGYEPIISAIECGASRR